MKSKFCERQVYVLIVIGAALICGMLPGASFAQTTYQPASTTAASTTAASTKAANTKAQQTSSSAKTAPAPAQSGKSATKAPASKLIDINSATVEQLKTLPGN